jgi:plastocyanin
MLKLTAAILSTAMLALNLAACGSSSSSSSTKAAAPPSSSSASSSAPASGAHNSTSLTIAADPSGQLKFTKSTLSAKPGKVKIAFTNNAPMAHNIMIQQGTDGRILGGTPTFQGGTKTVTLTLSAGTYTFFCSVPGHRQAGMQGTLTVR